MTENNRLDRLEEKVAWLENSLSEANSELDRQARTIADLESKLRLIASRLQAEPAVRPLSEETPPPHY